MEELSQGMLSIAIIQLESLVHKGNILKRLRLFAVVFSWLDSTSRQFHRHAVLQREEKLTEK